MFNARVKQLLDKVLPLSALNKQKSITQTSSYQGMKIMNDPTQLSLDTIYVDDNPTVEALSDAFAKHCHDLEHDGKHNNLESFITRSYEQMIRIAATLAIFDGKKKIGEDEMSCAIGLTLWFMQHRFDLDLDEAGGNIIVTTGEKIMEWAKRKEIKQCSRRDIMQKGPSCYRKMTTTERDNVID